MALKTRTIVLIWDDKDEDANSVYTKILADSGKYLKCLSTEDEYSILKKVLEHEDFPSHIEYDARKAVDDLYKDWVL